MSCLGVHFALTDSEVKKIKSMDDEQDRLEYLTEEIEEQYLEGDKEFAGESDKAWDAMHRALSDGELTWDGGKYPCNHVVLGGELLYTDDDYIMSLKNPSQVRDIFNAIEKIDIDDFRNKYFKIDPEDYGFELTEEDFEYTWDWFQNVRQLYKRAADNNRFVLFTADQ
jgi:hypothetical protein